MVTEMKKICLVVCLVICVLGCSVSSYSKTNSKRWGIDPSQYIFNSRHGCMHSTELSIRDFKKDKWKCTTATKDWEICKKCDGEYTTNYKFKCIGKTMHINGFISKAN